MSAEDLSRMLSKYREKSASDQAQGALLFSCLGRGEHLYGTPNHDSDLFKSKLGDMPLGGFSATAKSALWGKPPSCMAIPVPLASSAQAMPGAKRGPAKRRS